MTRPRLTKKQQMFVEEYLIDLNATQAAIRAGYSERSARKIGHQNLSKPNIAEAIREHMEKRSERVEVTADMVLDQLAKIAFHDVKDVLSWGMEESHAGFEERWVNGKLEKHEVKEMRMKVHMKDSNEIDGTIIQEVSEADRGGAVTHSVKLNDRMKALELIGKHLGMFKDKDDLNVNVGVQIVDDIEDEEEDDEEDEKKED